jgi:hypothetical protein
MPQFKDLNEALAEASRMIATARGEALGAQILATNVMIQLAQLQPDPAAFHKLLAQKCNASVDEVTINPPDELNEVMRETARKVCDESLSSLSKVLARK